MFYNNDLVSQITLDSHLMADGRQAQNWLIGAFHFPSLQMYFYKSSCLGRGSVDAHYKEWVSTGNTLTGGNTTNVALLTINLGSRRGLITRGGRY